MENSAFSPAIQLITHKSEKASKSFLGGLPNLPANFKWPIWDATPLYLDEIKYAEEKIRECGAEAYWNGQINVIRTKLKEPSVPLTFLGQIFLEDLPRYAGGLPNLPTSGALCFFVDLLNCPPGWRASSKGACRVIYLEDVSKLKIASPPDKAVKIHCHMFESEQFNQCYLSFEAGWTQSRFDQTLPASDATTDGREENNLTQFPLRDASNIISIQKRPMHQLLGYPYVIQNLMEEMCQLCFHGFDELKHDISDPEVSHLKEGIEDWQLLLQLDCDPNLDWEWGDCGMLYFWIRKQDLANKDFSKVWFEMQCS